MIQLTRINHKPLVVNSDLIEHIDSTPDTIISMTNGQKLVVLETVDEVVRRVVEFRSNILVIASSTELRRATEMHTQSIAHAPCAAA